MESTLNYSIFTEYQINRYNRESVYKKKKYKDLLRSIKEKGQLFPILVDSNYGIIDGNTRFTALKDLGLEVKFLNLNQSKEDCLELMLHTGITQRSWSAYDIANFHAARGVTPYIKLLELHSSTGIGMSFISMVSSKLLNGRPLVSEDGFNDGRMGDFDEIEIRKHLAALKPLISSKKFASKRTLINAFKYVLESRGFDEARDMFLRITYEANRSKKKYGAGETALAMTKMSAHNKADRYSFPVDISNN